MGKLKDLTGNGSHVIDLTGQKFGRLLVVSRVDKKASNGSACWRCQCDCGNPVDAYAKDLKFGRTKSCGCLNKEQRLNNFIRIDGTCVTKIKSDKLYTSNNSGIRGVGWKKSRGKWCARITFKQKTYELGCYEKLSDAAAIRKQAEGKVFGEFLEWYNSNFSKAK